MSSTLKYPLSATASIRSTPRLVRAARPVSAKQPEIGNLTMHLLLGNQLVLRVHRDLHVVPHPHASATGHRPGVGVGQRELGLATLLQRLTVRFETRLALSQRRNLLCQIPRPLLGLASAMSAASISSICCRYRSSRSWLAARSHRSLAPVKFRSRLFTALIRVPSTAIYLPAEQFQAPAHLHEVTEHWPERLPVLAPEIRNGLAVRPQAAQQPDHLQVAVGFRLQPTAGPHPVQIPVDVQLQQRVVA